MTIQLKHSKSGAIKKTPIGFSLTTLLFGGFVPLFRGDIGWAIGYLIVTACTMGIYHFIFPFTYNKIYIKKLLGSDYVPADERSSRELSKRGLISANDPVASVQVEVPSSATQQLPNTVAPEAPAASVASVEASPTTSTSPVEEVVPSSPSSHPHILGRGRFPIVLTLSIVGVIAQNVYLPNLKIFEGLNQFASGFALFCVGLLLFWILTVENLIKWTMGLLFGAGAGFAAAKIMEVVAPDLKKYGPLLGLAVGLVTAVTSKLGLDKSSWIGTPCPSCFTRGKLDYTQINKQFLGTRYGPPKYSLASTQKDHRSWNLYNITERHWCDACGHEWIENRETEEGA
jgi:hypothetical protein